MNKMGKIKGTHRKQTLKSCPAVVIRTTSCLLDNMIAKLRGGVMPSFERQYWNGYSFKLHSSGFIRTYLAYFYHYGLIYFNGANINFDLAIGIPNENGLEKIKFEWELYDRETKKVVKNNSGFITYFREKSRIRAKSDGRYLEKMIPTDGHKYGAFLGLPKAIKLGYQVDEMKCYIKMKFIIGEKEFVSEPMAVFNIYDKDEINKSSIFEFGVTAVVGAIIGFIIGHILH